MANESGSETAAFGRATQASVDIYDCVVQNGQLNIALNTEIWISYRHFTKSISPLHGEMNCTVSMATRPGFVVSVLVLDQSCVEGNDVMVEEIHGSKTWDGCERRVAPGLDYTSESDLTTTVTVRNTSVPFSVRLSIRLVAQKTFKQNQLRFVSTSKGYIQSLGFDPDHPKMVSDGVDSWTTVDVPSGHVTMLSIAHVAIHIDIRADVIAVQKSQMLSLHAGSARKQVWRYPYEGNIVPGSVVLHSSEFRVHWKYGRTRKAFRQFRVFFSFHKISSTPQQLPGGLWNCSSSTYPDFELHFLCNLKTECDGGRDEEGCHHTPCDHDGVVVAGNCFFLAPSTAVWDFNWYDAMHRCAAHGARLASLNTVEKRNHVIRLLRLIWLPSMSNIYLGVMLTSSRLPAMYDEDLKL